MKTCKSFANDGKGNGRRKERSEGTLESLIRRYEGQAHQFAYCLAGNSEEAKELVQQASVQILRNWKRYDPLKSFQNWYLTIVKNLFLDALRRPSPRLTVSLDQPVGNDERESLADALADGKPGPLEQMERRELIEATRQSLDALNESHRAVLILCDIEGMRYEDAARRLRLPLGTMRSRLFRARAVLRRDPRLRCIA
jgi:RNA polymerase sigma-70 factor (ECF subfamily)